jgi:CRISPR-associated protein Csh2
MQPETALANADLLFLYEAKDTNPNGDPDGDNRPRMDYVGQRLLVSDVRIKRYVRDYLLNRGEDIWVRTREDGSHVDADGRLEELKA